MIKPQLPWLVSEEKILRERWEAGDQMIDIAAKIPRHSLDAIRKHREKLGVSRPSWFVPYRECKSWTAIHRALTAKPGMSIYDLVAETGCAKATCTRLIDLHHGHGVYVKGWRVTARKPAALWALGHLTDVKYVPVRAISRRPVIEPSHRFAALVNQLTMGVAA